VRERRKDDKHAKGQKKRLKISKRMNKRRKDREERKR
jgi:hypothetical protein